MLIVGLLLVALMVIWISGVFTPVAPVGTCISEEQLENDIRTILWRHGLFKGNDLLIRDSNSFVDSFRLKGVEIREGKILFLNVSANIFNNLYHYDEIESLMDIWLYLSERESSFELDGIVYYFSAPAEFLGAARANEIYMTTEEFHKIYDTTDMNVVERLIHNQKIKKLANVYVEQNGYHRSPGHIQAGKGRIGTFFEKIGNIILKQIGFVGK